MSFSVDAGTNVVTHVCCANVSSKELHQGHQRLPAFEQTGLII